MQKKIMMALVIGGLLAMSYMLGHSQQTKAGPIRWYITYERWGSAKLESMLATMEPFDIECPTPPYPSTSCMVFLKWQGESPDATPIPPGPNPTSK